MGGTQVLVMQRDTVSAILNKIIKVCKAKDNDPNLRRLVLIEPRDDGKVNIFATNEISSFLFTDVDGAIDLEGELAGPVSFAVGLDKLTKFASSTTDESLKFRLCTTEDKLTIRSGSASLDIGYFNGVGEGGYFELYGDSNPTVVDSDVSEYTKVEDISGLCGLLKSMLICTDSSAPHLSGIYTDGNGKFMSTILTAALEVDSPTNAWDFECIIPSDFVSMLDSLPEDAEAYIRLSEGKLFIRDKVGSVVISTFTKEVSKFPASALLKAFDDADTGDKMVNMNSSELRQVISRMKSLFGDELVFTMKFTPNKVKITVLGEGNDRGGDVISYSVLDGSEPVVDFSFQMHRSVLAILCAIQDGNIVLRMGKETGRFITTNDSGIRAVFSTFKKQARKA